MKDFITDRVKSLISKKLGAAVIGETLVATAQPEMIGQPTIVYIIAQAIVVAIKHFTEQKSTLEQK